MNKHDHIIIDGEEFIGTSNACKILDIPQHALYHFINKGFFKIIKFKKNRNLFFNKKQILETKKDFENHVCIMDFITRENINRDAFYRHRTRGKIPKPRHLTYVGYSRPSFYTKSEISDILVYLKKLGPHAFNKAQD